MTIVRKEIPYGDTMLVLETGYIAKQAFSIFVSNGDSQALVNITSSAQPKDLPFLPMTVEYQERAYAAGRIPGGFFKREGRPKAEEVINARITDRTLRPLFPDGFRREVQIILTVMSSDGAHEMDACCLTAAATALTISDLPWAPDGPVAGVRTARVDGTWVLNPTVEQRAASDIDLMVGASAEAIVMVEGGANEANEDDVIEGLYLAFDAAQPIIAAINEIREEIGAEKSEHIVPAIDADVTAAVAAAAAEHQLAESFTIKIKHERYAAKDAAKAAIKTQLKADDNFADRYDQVKAALGEFEHHAMRRMTLDSKRIDGRGYADIRAIETQTDVLKRTHGSALFQRGETQAIVTCTLGSKRDERKIEWLHGTEWRRFMLHYNFPPYSVGEARPMRGTSRREIGHGMLARRALEPMIPSAEDFPYTVRVVSEITESNGSSSMASVCGGSMAMMAAGVPLLKPVAGIAMGMIKEGDDVAILSDILGDEDHLGDMDFKVTGTTDGITAIQMDIKVDGLSRDLLTAALEQARTGRLHILGEMAKTMDTHREEMCEFAPRIEKIEVPGDKIRDIIGPGGKMIREIQSTSGAQVDVDEDLDRGVGIITIMCADGTARATALQMIEDLIAVPEVGKTYLGNVRKVLDFGAFVRIMPGVDGLLHVSEIAWQRVDHPSDMLQEGDELEVKVLEVDERSGKVRLSRRVLLDKPEGFVERPPRERSDRGGDRGGRSGGGGRDGNRGRSGGGDRNSGRGEGRSSKPSETET
jgi:polyribonucleotide nucleotidyltransferase